MKRFFLTILSFTLISFYSAGQFAIVPDDMPAIEKALVVNDDGDSIGYYFNIDEKTASVTYRGNNFYDNEYSDTIVIPKEVKYNGETYLVTKIGDNAFEGCSKLTNVSIPNSVTKIGRFSFRGCRKLTNVTIPDNVKEIAWRAFMACTNLTEVTIPANTATINDEAFVKCSTLKSIVVEKGSQNYCSENGILYDKSKTTLLKCPEGKEGELLIPNGVKKIHQNAFSNCKITEVTIPANTATIDDEAFITCSTLKSIVVEKGNPNYCSENGVLYDKSKTTLLKCPVGKEGELIIPNGVKKIHPNAFSNCKITEVTIPNSLIEIGRYSFSHCTLKSITCNCVNPPAMYNKYGFYGVEKNIPVYVPSKSVEKYKNAVGWNEFKNILPISAK